MRPKIAVIGAGHVGATCAQRILERNLADVALVDVVEGLAQGKALDLAQAAPLEGHGRAVQGSTSYEIIRGCSAVVVTAGLARQPGMSRSDLLEANAKIVGSIVPQVVAQCPDAVLLIVTNPLDAMTYLAWRMSQFPRERVIGMAGVLDSARLRFFVAERLKVSARDVHAQVLGGHGDQMVPLPRYTTVSGVALTELLPMAEIDRLMQRTREGGAEVVRMLKTGSAYYAPASSAADMVQAILGDERRLLPACVHLNGPYGLRDVFCGVPIRLGGRGVEEIVELPLNESEKKALAVSAEGVRQEMQAVDRILKGSVPSPLKAKGV